MIASDRVIYDEQQVDLYGYLKLVRMRVLAWYDNLMGNKWTDTSWMSGSLPVRGLVCTVGVCWKFCCAIFYFS